MNRWAVAGLAALMGVGGAGTAQAATIDLAGGTMSYSAAAGEGNQPTFFTERDGADAIVRIKAFDYEQASLTITSGARAAGCKYSEEFDPSFTDGDPIQSPHAVSCPVPQRIGVDAGDGDDSVGMAADVDLPVNASLGAGDDTYFGSSGVDVVSGGDGQDRLYGWPGNDRLSGDAGNDEMNGMQGDDTLDGGDGDDSLEALREGPAVDDLAGADTYVGGPGVDHLSFFLNSTGVSVTFDGQANDGAAGEGDNVGSDIERIAGGSGADTLVGDDRSNELTGNEGNDRIEGGGGSDVLTGNLGNDTISGGAGDDGIAGNEGSDELQGGAGSDNVVGDDLCPRSGPCGAGQDKVDVSDGEADTVSCGALTDTVIADSLDNVDRSQGELHCENVTVADVDGGGASVSAPRSLKLKSFLSRGLPLTISCAGRCSASAKAMVDKRTQRKLGLRSRTVASGKATLGSGSGRVAVKLSRKAKRAFKRVRRAKLTIVVTVKDANGTSRGTLRTTIKR